MIQNWCFILITLGNTSARVPKTKDLSALTSKVSFPTILLYQLCFHP